MEKETRIPCTSCEGTGGEFGNECSVCQGLGYRKGFVSTISNTFFMVVIAILFVLLAFSAFGQTPVMYGGSYSPSYFDYNYEGTYTLHEQWVVVEKDTFVGYWQDSLFVSNNRMFLFKQNRVEKLTKVLTMNTLYKWCSYADLPYWTVVGEYFNGTKFHYLIGFDDSQESVIRIHVQNPVYNTFTGVVTVEQNGLKYFLSSPIKNSEQ